MAFVIFAICSSGVIESPPFYALGCSGQFLTGKPLDSRRKDELRNFLSQRAGDQLMFGVGVRLHRHGPEALAAHAIGEMDRAGNVVDPHRPVAWGGGDNELASRSHEIEPYGANRSTHFDRCTHRSALLSLTWNYRPAYI